MKIPLLLLLLSGVTACWATDSPERLDLTGRVTNSAGEPVPGAVVLLLAAGPRTGSIALCPYVFEDCGKRTASDAQGDFRLTSLDPAMNFCIAALAPGYEPYVNSSLLPEAGPVPVKMQPRDLSKLPPSRHVAGRIIDEEGRPVAGAILSVQGIELEGRTYWGGNNTTESQVITDGQGEFHFAGNRDFDAVHVTLEAPGLAARWAHLETGKSALIRMKVGAGVKGRLILNGQPLEGVTLAASSSDRECGKYFNVGHVTTDAEGKFAFLHLPAGTKFHLFAQMASLREGGANFQQTIVTGANGAEENLQDLPAQSAYRLSGRVVLSDGHPIPSQTRIILARGETIDNLLAVLDGEGRFEFRSVPSEPVSLFVGIPGYHYSRENPNLDRNSASAIIGQLAGDQSDLKILLEPGPPPNENDLDHPTPEERTKMSTSPFRSAP